jgi:hypothetical protein
MLELVVSCLYLAAIVGAMWSEVTARKFGRKVCASLQAFVFTDACVFCPASNAVFQADIVADAASKPHLIVVFLECLA